MRLIYHPLSPYSRKVYMLALELNLADQISLQQVVVAPIPYPGWSDNNDLVAGKNPLAKIPTLAVDDAQDGGDGLAIFDSRVICDFLEDLTRGRGTVENSANGSNAGFAASTPTVSSYWLNKTIHACSDGMLDAEVLVVYEERIRDERGLKFQTWIDGQRTKVSRGFDFLERQARDGVLRLREQEQDVSAAEVAVAASVAFLEIRGVTWKEGRPCLVKWVDNWRGRESFVKTDSKVDWKAGSKVKD